ncbi:MAG: hypothetical protein M3R61_00210 [Chloroflexota bacterium]|nr:hypothetical protein [Chloroflexota bacterium]
MSDYTLNIIVNGQDGASAPLQDVAQQLKGVGDAADSTGGQTGGFFSNLLATAGGFLAANVIGSIAGQFKDFVVGGIADAQGAAQLMASTEQTITTMGNAAGMSAQQVADMASSLSDAAGKSLFGDDKIQQASNLLLTFGAVKGATFDAATALTVDLAAALGGEPQAQAMMLGKALNDPIKGMSALGKAGLTFSAEQKAAIKAMQESGDMAGAQALIIAELNKQVGGQAEAQAKAAGGMVQFQARLGEVGETIGAALLPVLASVANTLLTTVIPGIEKAADWLGANLPGAIATLTAAVGPVVTWLGANLPGAIATLTAAVGPVLAAFTQMSAGSSALGGALGDLSAVWTQLQPAIATVVGAVSALVMAVFGQVQTFLDAHGADIQATLTDAWTQIMEIVKVGIALYNAIIPPVLLAIAGFITAHGATIQRILGNTWDAIKALIDAALTLIRGVLTAALQLIQGDWSGAWETIKTMSARIVSDLITVIKAGLDNLRLVFTGAIDAIKTAWDVLVTGASVIGANIIAGIISGVKSGVSALASAVQAAAQGALDAAKNALGLGGSSGGGGGGGSSDPAARASGGPVSGGTPYMVGEQGPELFVPRTSGAILSTPATAALFGGGGTDNRTYITIAPGAIVIQQQPGQNADQLAELVIRKVTDKLALRRA